MVVHISEEPVLPDYGGACIDSVVPALLGKPDKKPSWLPEVAFAADQVVLLVLDGLGWNRLSDAMSGLPTFSQGIGGPITSVAPTTTATALTSIATGSSPASHGVVGYRVLQDDEIMNVLQWRSRRGDLRQNVPASTFQQIVPFQGRAIPVVTRADFAPTGFSAAHLRGSRLVGWQVPSTLVLEVRRLLHSGEPFVHAYYDGLDKVAHSYGTGEHYLEELRFVDHLLSEIVSTLPAGAALVVTSDHGQVDVSSAVRTPSAELMSTVERISGEGRFRWFHAKSGAADDLLAAASENHGDEAWVMNRRQIEAAGWFGGQLSVQGARRLGDVAVVARAPVAFLDPADTGESGLVGRHGSLTSDEMFVPLIAWGDQ